MDAMQATIVTPLPGTGLYERLHRENRLLYTNYPEDWERYHFMEVIHRPLTMQPEELMEEMWKNWKVMYDHKIIQKKMLRTLKATNSKQAAAWSYLSNVERHNVVFGTNDPIDPAKYLGGLLPET
jgi:radical SAM superfamily enzyme YgiQ (UPF0313 family)